VILALSLAVSGCANAGRNDARLDVGVGQGAVVALSPEVAARLVSGQRHLAATQGKLLAVGGLDAVTNEPGYLQVPDSALLVDVDTGEATELPAPRSDVPVHVLGATADANGFLVLGARCANGNRLDARDWGCEGGAAVAFRLDLNGAAKWQSLELPASFEQREAQMVFQVVTLDVTATGKAFALVQNGPASEPGRPARQALVLEAGSWHVAAELSSDRLLGACGAGDTTYVLQETGAQAGGVALTAVALEDGALTSVHLPDLYTGYGATAVRLGCDASGPYLTTSKPDDVTPLTLYALREGSWAPIGGDWAPSVIDSITSASIGVAVRTFHTSPARYEIRMVRAGDTAARTLPESAQYRTLVPEFGGDSFVTVGPFPAPFAEEDGTPDSKTQAMTIERVKP
ncbi:MAG: hypothetical protein ACT4OV_14315, partial [Microthrixaceae bacterium]